MKNGKGILTSQTQAYSMASSEAIWKMDMGYSDTWIMAKFIKENSKIISKIDKNGDIFKDNTKMEG